MIDLRGRGARFVCLAAALSAVLSAAPRLARTQRAAPDTFADLFHDYRRGDADRAVRVLASWPHKRVEAEAKLLPGENDAWSKAALALLLFETWMGWPPVTDTAEHLIGDAERQARSTGDVRLRAFCRDVYLVALATNSAHLDINAEGQVGRLWADDALAQLELGKHAERYIELLLTADRDGYAAGSGGPFHLAGTSSHGAYGAYAGMAEGAFRRALALDSRLFEARVHLGRVLWFFDRRDEAERELTEAATEAMAARAPEFAYLANLFLAQLQEERGSLDAATAAYEEALRIYPNGQVARLALGQLRLATGHEADGWMTTATALDPAAWDRRPPDPWRIYTLDVQAWWPAVRLRTLRSQVRQQ
jgi:tetratricopeptide (TPR) repeat protein